MIFKEIQAYVGLPAQRRSVDLQEKAFHVSRNESLSKYSVHIARRGNEIRHFAME
jgi:hypothetical protein